MPALRAASAAVFDALAGQVGAVVAGRKTYDDSGGWDGGGPHPTAPLFVLTRPPLPNVPPTSSQAFVTTGITDAISSANRTAAAAGKDVASGHRSRSHAMPLPATGQTTTASPAEVHRRLVEHYLAGQFEDALVLIDPDVIDHRGGTDGDHHGRDAWRAKWEHARTSGFHDLSATIQDNTTAGDRSANRYTLRGTHTATGRTYEVTGLDLIRVRNGKVIEHWALQDVTALQAQLTPDNA